MMSDLNPRKRPKSSGRRPDVLRARAVSWIVGAWVFSALLATAPALAQTPGIYLVESDAVVPMEGGYLGLNCNHLQDDGLLLLGAGEIDSAHDVSIEGVLDAGNGVIHVGGNWSAPGIFLPGSSTVTLDGSCRPGPVEIATGTHFCRLQLASTGVEYRLPADSEIAIDCELDLGVGNLVVASGAGPTRIVLGPRANLVGTAALSGVIVVSAAAAMPVPGLGPSGLMLLALMICGVAFLRSERTSIARVTRRAPARRDDSCASV